VVENKGRHSEGVSAGHFALSDMYRTQKFPNGKLQVRFGANPQPASAPLLADDVLRSLHMHIADKPPKRRRDQSGRAGGESAKDKFPFRCPCTLASCNERITGPLDCVRDQTCFQISSFSTVFFAWGGLRCDLTSSPRGLESCK
jgi:hypothetical protein